MDHWQTKRRNCFSLLQECLQQAVASTNRASNRAPRAGPSREHRPPSQFNSWEVFAELLTAYLLFCILKQLCEWLLLAWLVTALVHVVSPDR